MEGVEQMIMRNSDFLLEKSQLAGKERWCPECGGSMSEVNRCNEGQAVFIWLNCSNNGCDGQWLEKIPPIKRKIFVSGEYRG
jgi:hypothetical protein